MLDSSRVTIEGRLYRESEHEPYGDRLFVKVDRAGEQGAIMLPSSGHVRVAVPGGDSFQFGDDIRLSARIHFPRNYANPGEFDYAGLMAREGIDATMTAPKKSLGTPVFRKLGHRSRFPASQIESIRTHIGEFFDRNLAYPEKCRDASASDRRSKRNWRAAAANVRPHRHGALARDLGTALEHCGRCDFRDCPTRDDAVSWAGEPRLREQGRRPGRDARRMRVRIHRRSSRVDGARTGDGARVYACCRDRSSARGDRVAGACGDRNLCRAARFDRGHRFSALVRVGDCDRARDASIRRLVRAPETNRDASRRTHVAWMAICGSPPVISRCRSGRWPERLH